MEWMLLAVVLGLIVYSVSLAKDHLEHARRVQSCIHGFGVREADLRLRIDSEARERDVVEDRIRDVKQIIAGLESEIEAARRELENEHEQGQQFRIQLTKQRLRQLRGKALA